MRRVTKLWLGLAAVALVVPAIALASQGVTPRPLADFVDAQGASGSNFFPPVPDYLGWVDGDFETFALVDYAGLAAAYINAQPGSSIRTNVGGYVNERENDDGSAEVTVRLRTANALAFAQSVQDLIDSGFDFLGTATIFGKKAQDVVAGADASTGWVQLELTFTISEPGDDLPDFLDILNTTDYAPATMDFRSRTVGRLPDGSQARLTVHEVASTVSDGAGGWVWVFTKEVVEIAELGN